MNLNPTPRLYTQTPFRSSLEADWACTLDHLNISWQYEPAAFTLPSGDIYIPDFHLPQIGTWIEVKGQDVPGVSKAIQFATIRTCPCTETCTCQWAGGELVLIGLPAAKRSGMRYGALAWRDPLNVNTALEVCRKCGVGYWWRPSMPIMCRSCQSRHMDGHLHRSGEYPFRHAWRGSGTEVDQSNVVSNAVSNKQVRRSYTKIRELSTAFDLPVDNSVDNSEGL